MNEFVEKDPKKFDPVSVQKLLKQSYWAEDRSLEAIERSIQNSLVYGIFERENLVAFGRVVTDYATMYWICDIIVDKDYRGHAYGKRIVEAIDQTTCLTGLKGILVTKDAHSLYEKIGFRSIPDILMMKMREE